MRLSVTCFILNKRWINLFLFSPKFHINQKNMEMKKIRYQFSFSLNLSIFILIRSKPCCQNEALVISNPESLSNASGFSDPPADSILMYFEIKELPSSLNC